MKILKKRVNDTGVVLIGNNIYTLSGVTTDNWLKIVEAIDALKECDTPENYTILMEDLLDLVDLSRIARRKALDKILEDAIMNGTLESDEESRMRKAKRIADISNLFEYDEHGFTYLKGFSYPMPKIMTEAVLDAYYNPSSQFTTSSLINFWKYLLLNPDRHVREGLFLWIKSGKFAITEEGNIIAYRNVDVKIRKDNGKLIDFVAESWSKVKRWKKSPKNYIVVFNDNMYRLVESAHKTELGTAHTSFGTLDVLMDTLVYTDKGTVYKPQHVGPYGQEIIIGKPVSMPREECDNDPHSSCSRGLHSKSASYGLNLGSELLITLINPYNVVAIPKHDTTKFRCCEYLPISRAETEQGNLVEFAPGTYDIEYNGISSLEQLLKTTSLKELQSQGLVSNEVSEHDMKIVLDHAREVISKKVVKVIK